MHLLVIGTGSIGERHLRNALRLQGVACSIAEMNPRTRDRVAGEYPVAASYADYREADLASFDGVVICVPADLHVPIASEVVRAGTHVLTEKPLAMSLDGIEELKRLRDANHVVVSVAFTLRSDPIIAEAKRRIRDADVGPIRFATYKAGQYWPRMRKDYPPAYAQKRESGGGAIPDHLVHVINYLEWFFGPPVEVSARQWRLALEDIRTEDSAHVVLRFAGGEIAVLSICLFQQDTGVALEIIGDDGTLRTRLDAETLEIYRSSSEAWMPGDARAAERDDVFLSQTEHFIDCIKGRDTPRCTIEEAEQTLRTVLSALESSDGDGRFVPVTSP